MSGHPNPFWDHPGSRAFPSPTLPADNSHDFHIDVTHDIPARTRSDTEDSMDTMVKPGDIELAEQGVPYRAARRAEWRESKAGVDVLSQPKSLEELKGLSSFEQRFLYKLYDLPNCFISRSPRIHRALLYLRGPRPAVAQTSLKPLLPKVESFFDRIFEPLAIRRVVITPLFLLVWLIAFIFLVKKSYWNASTNLGTPQFIAGDDSFWSKDAGCGINGTYCTPFTNSSLVFRCPAQVLDIQLLNNRAVGSQELIYSSLVVGGLDADSTYRGDSWICPAAIQHGLFKNQRGGCGKLERVGQFQGFTGGSRNGVDSVSFASTFPSSYRFVEGVTQTDCIDLRDDILGFNVAMTTIFSFVIRPAPAPFFWTLFIMGFWHVVLASDPTANPPDLEAAFQYFLPALFFALAMWRFCFRWVVPAFEGAVLERTVWYLGGFWVGVLINISLAWIPISRLTPHDIQQRPGGLVAVIVLVIFLVLVIANQLRVIRKTGWLFHYVTWYVVGGVILGILCSLPTLEFRLHHYIAAILLLPGTAFVTRPSALFQGFLLGMFLDGAGRWGFDSILQTVATLTGDGATGSPLPNMLTSAANFTANQASIAWSAIPSDIASSWNGFALIVDDVLVWTGSATNYSIAALDATIPHYFRLAYQNSGTYGDFPKAATAFISNGTWIDSLPGAG